MTYNANLQPSLYTLRFVNRYLPFSQPPSQSPLSFYYFFIYFVTQAANRDSISCLLVVYK